MLLSLGCSMCMFGTTPKLSLLEDQCDSLAPPHLMPHMCLAIGGATQSTRRIVIVVINYLRYDCICVLLPGSYMHYQVFMVDHLGEVNSTITWNTLIPWYLNFGLSQRSYNWRDSCHICPKIVTYCPGGASFVTRTSLHECTKGVLN